MAVNWATSASLAGARDLNFMHRQARQEDLGFKLERMISTVNVLNDKVSFVMEVVNDIVSSMSTVDGASSFLLTASATGIPNIAELSAVSLATMSNFRA